MDMAAHPQQQDAHVQPADVTRWADLADNAAEPNSFYAPELLIPALQHLNEAQGVHLIEVEAQGRLIGLMPVNVSARHSRFPVRNVTNWMHLHCFYGAPLIRRGAEADAWRGFLRQIDAADWAPGFLHLSGIDAAGANAKALEAVCVEQNRALHDLVRHDRALLRSTLSAEAYWEASVRPKKRKEIRRLQKRLGEQGTVTHTLLTEPRDLQHWCDDFLKLEAAGWKGANGTAMANAPGEEAFFRSATAAAMATGHLAFLRIDLDGQAIAMLVNFLRGAGAFSFKIAFDEAHGRFSPGVLIELDNLDLVQGSERTAWMDSCAAPDHPMIDSLWGERRSIAQYRVALKGRGMQKLRRDIAMAGVHAAEALVRRLKGA